MEQVKSSMSVLGNGQDGKNDAGQFAMIDKIQPGTCSMANVPRLGSCTPSVCAWQE